MAKFGPGSLIFGDEGSELDQSCQVNSLTITASKDQGDSRTMLCGTSKPGALTYEYSMTGNLDTDTEDAEGFFAFTQANAGSQVPFVFIPNTPTETSAAGVVIVDPLDFGGEEYGEDMNSDIEFTIVGQPEYTYPAAPVTPAALSSVRHGSRKAGSITPQTRAALDALKAKQGGSQTSTTPAPAPEPEPVG